MRNISEHRRGDTAEKWRQVGSGEREQEIGREILVRLESSMKFRMAGAQGQLGKRRR